MPADLDAMFLAGERPRSLRGLFFPRPLEILVLAPHPDDFDAIGLALRHLHGQGHAVHVAVLTTGASGVEDGFEGATGAAAGDLERLAAWLAARPADLFFEFGEADAAWKGQLLRCHRSQQERNLRLRGAGFDARVLQVNRQAAAALGTPLPYAESFELMRLGRPSWNRAAALTDVKSGGGCGL